MKVAKSLFVGRSISICIISVCLLAACENNTIHFNDENLIVGVASPISINPDSTEINLEDFVLQPTKIDSLGLPKGLALKRVKNQIMVTGTMASKIGVLRIWSNGQAYCIPLQKVNKQKVTLTYASKAKEVKTKGEFNAWNADNSILKKEGDVFQISMWLNPGNYQYLFVVDGKEKREPSNKDSVDNGIGGWNSFLRIPRPDSKKIPSITTNRFTDNTITLTLLNPASEITVFWKNFLLDATSIKQSDTEVEITIPSQASKEERSFIRAWAANEEGISNDVLIPLQNGRVVNNSTQLTRFDKEANILYFMMIDRFNNGKKENDEPVKDAAILPKANYYGGDIAGVTQKIKDGYFTSLGINTIWLLFLKIQQALMENIPTQPLPFLAIMAIGQFRFNKLIIVLEIRRS
jgi:cyclomaltodextrinase / maltogenic alpha-amylase / neopullulanase